MSKDGYTEQEVEENLSAEFRLLIQAAAFKTEFDKHAKGYQVKLPGTSRCLNACQDESDVHFLSVLFQC